MNHIVTGANRGIGLELVRQLARAGHRVEALCRQPEKATELLDLVRASGGKVRISMCDVGDPASIAKFAKEHHDGPIDRLINNAGTFGTRDRPLGELDYAEIEEVIRINTFGPLRMVEALLPSLRMGARADAPKKILHISTGMASIGDNGSGGHYAYRMSKVALNMASMNLARELKKDHIASYVMNPGWVQTDMGGKGAPTSPEESVRGILETFEKATMEDSGEFLDYRGKRFPW